MVILRLVDIAQAIVEVANQDSDFQLITTILNVLLISSEPLNTKSQLVILGQRVVLLLLHNKRRPLAWTKLNNWHAQSTCHSSGL